MWQLVERWDVRTEYLSKLLKKGTIRRPKRRCEYYDKIYLWDLSLDTLDWILLRQDGSQWQTDVNNAVKYLEPHISMNMMEENWVYYVLRCFNTFCVWRGSIKYLLELRPPIGTVQISAVIYEHIYTVDEIMLILIFKEFKIQVLWDAAAMSTRNSCHMSQTKRNYFRLGFVRRA
jgi:hypothetical protein